MRFDMEGTLWNSLKKLLGINCKCELIVQFRPEIYVCVLFTRKFSTCFDDLQNKDCSFHWMFLSWKIFLNFQWLTESIPCIRAVMTRYILRFIRCIWRGPIKYEYHNESVWCYIQERPIPSDMILHYELRVTS